MTPSPPARSGIVRRAGAALGALPDRAGALAVRARLVVVPVWIALAVVATLALPGPGDSGAELGLPVPRDAAAIRAEQTSYRAFGFPLISRTMVVQREPGGLGTT